MKEKRSAIEKLLSNEKMTLQEKMDGLDKHFDQILNRKMKRKKGCEYCGQDENKPVQKNCGICGEKFDSYHRLDEFHGGGIHMVRGCYFEPFCDTCKEKIKEVDWYGHHRKDPTKKELEREVQTKINRLRFIRKNGSPLPPSPSHNPMKGHGVKVERGIEK